MLFPGLGNHYGYKDPEFLRLLDFNDNFRIMSSRWARAQPMPNAEYIKLPRVDH